MTSQAARTQHYDVVILGAGAAGLMCAISAGGRGRRVLVLDHAKTMHRPSIDAVVDTDYALFEDSGGCLWAGANSGVFMLDDGHWHIVMDDVRSRANYIRYFAEAPDGGLWMATNGQGIVYWSEGEVARIDTDSGLISNNIRALLVDETEHGYVLLGRLRRPRPAATRARSGRPFCS